MLRRKLHAQGDKVSYTGGAWRQDIYPWAQPGQISYSSLKTADLYIKHTWVNDPGWRCCELYGIQHWISLMMSVGGSLKDPNVKERSWKSKKRFKLNIQVGKRWLRRGTRWLQPETSLLCFSRKCCPKSKIWSFGQTYSIGQVLVLFKLSEPRQLFKPSELDLRVNCSVEHLAASTSSLERNVVDIKQPLGGNSTAIEHLWLALDARIQTMQHIFEYSINSQERTAMSRRSRRIQSKAFRRVSQRATK